MKHGSIASLLALGALASSALADPTADGRAGAYKRHAAAVLAETTTPVKTHWVWTQRSFGDHEAVAQDTKGQVRLYRPTHQGQKDREQRPTPMQLQVQPPRADQPGDAPANDLRRPIVSHGFELRRHP